MSPDNDRCTSQASASSDHDQSDAPVTAFSSSRRIAHSGFNSVHRDSKARRRVRMARITCTSDEQNHSRTGAEKGTSRNSRPFDIGSSCQYWGRRRYGPAQQVFRMA